MTRVGSTGRGLGVAGGEGTNDDVGRQQEQCLMPCCKASIERRVTPRSGVVEGERANPWSKCLIGQLDVHSHTLSLDGLSSRASGREYKPTTRCRRRTKTIARCTRYETAEPRLDWFNVFLGDAPHRELRRTRGDNRPAMDLPITGTDGVLIPRASKHPGSKSTKYDCRTCHRSRGGSHSTYCLWPRRCPQRPRKRCNMVAGGGCWFLARRDLVVDGPFGLCSSARGRHDANRVAGSDAECSATRYTTQRGCAVSGPGSACRPPA